MGFLPRTEMLLNRAAQICSERGVRLTDTRRLILGLILDKPQPTGAYELLDQLRGARESAAPPTVYRALDFLLEQGLIHKLERLSAFVGCVAEDDHAHTAPVGLPEGGDPEKVAEAAAHGPNALG